MVKEIVRKAQEGDKQSMEQLYTENVGKIYRYILSNISDSEMSQDLTSTVFAKAFGNITAFKGDSSFTTWVYAITRNELYKYYTEKKIATEIFTPFEEEELSIEESEDEVTLEEDIAALKREEHAKEKVSLLFTKLPRHYSEVLRLKYLMSMTFKEIAIAMNITRNYAKVLHNRAIKKAHKLL